MEAEGTLADENQESYQCLFSAHHMFDKMPSSNSPNKIAAAAAAEISDSTDFSGVRKRKWDPITKKRVLLGTFNSTDEASEAYLAKQREFVSAQHMFDEMPSSNLTDKTTEISDSIVVDLQHAANFSGVRKRKQGEYIAEKWDPITKERVWSGTFNSVEEASEAYLAKHREFVSAQHMFDEMPSSNSTNKTAAAGERDKADQGKTLFIKEVSFRDKNGLLGAEWHNMGRLRKKDPFKKRKVRKSSNSNIDESKKPVNVVNQGKEPVICVESDRCNTVKRTSKPKTGILGIRKQKNGRYGAEIRDPIKHKQVWLGTFDTIQEASQAYLSKKSEFDMLSQGNKENKSKNCDQIRPESSVGASLFMADDQTLNAANGGRNKENKAKNCDQTQPESSVGASLFVADDQTLHAANVGRNKENKSKHCDQIQPESSVGASLFVANDQTLHAASVGRNEKNDSHKTMRIVGVHKNKWGKYTSEIINPISKKKIWLGTFGTYEEASQVYQSKKLEFKKLVKPKKKCNKKTHSNAREKQVGKEKLVNAKQGHVNYEGLQPESAVKFDVQSSKKAELQSLKFDVQSSKKAELQSQMSVDFSTGEKQAGQEDADLWMGQWVQLPSGKEVNFSLKLGLPIIDNYGSLLGEFSSLDDLRIYDESIY